MLQLLMNSKVTSGMATFNEIATDTFLVTRAVSHFYLDVR